MQNRLSLRRHHVVTTCMFALIVTACSVVLDDAADVRSAESFRAFEEQFFKAEFEYSPLSASSAGLHEYDTRIDDFSAAAYRARITALRDFGQQLERLLDGELSSDDRIDAEALELRIAGELHDLGTLRSWQQDPMQYAGVPGDAIGSLMNRDYAPAETRLRSMVTRMQRLPSVFEAAKNNLDSPPAILVEIAADMSRGTREFIDRSVSAWVTASEIDDTDLLQDYEAASAELSSAADAFADWLVQDLLPRSRLDFALGEEAFLKKLYYQDMLSISLDELLAIGERQLRKDYAALIDIAREISPDRDPLEVINALKEDFPDPENLLSTIEDSINEARDFVIDNAIATVPSEVIPIIAETPVYARDGSFASMDTPGAFETLATEAYYYVTPTEPDWTPQHVKEHLSLFNPYTVAMINVHEAFPGHFLQFLYAQEFPTLTRKLVESPMNAEGWAHYTEEMMTEQGFNAHDPRFRMSQLTEALIRDVRYVAGVRMHTKGMTVEEAADMFETKSFLSPANALAEAERGAWDPTYLYYTYGKLEIQKLAQDYQEKYGASLKDFHDAFVRVGPLPLPLVRRALLN